MGPIVIDLDNDEEEEEGLLSWDKNTCSYDSTILKKKNQNMNDRQLSSNKVNISELTVEQRSSISGVVDKETSPFLNRISYDDESSFPDLHALFQAYDTEYFSSRLRSVEVRWAKRMTLCAGICVYERGGYCSIRLSEPLLKFRTVKEFRETLLHEMIHAYLFVSQNNKDRDGHGPVFLSHMERINKLTGLNITVYHNFRDEVDHYRTHIWKCNGLCQFEAPYYGILKRSMNRAPGPSDFWWSEHQLKCGGQYIKVSEPEVKRKSSKDLGNRITGKRSLSKKIKPSSLASSSKQISLSDFFKEGIESKTSSSSSDKKGVGSKITSANSDKSLLEHNSSTTLFSSSTCTVPCTICHQFVDQKLKKQHETECVRQRRQKFYDK